MDNFRLILAIMLSLLGTMIWEAWQTDYVRPKQALTIAEPSIKSGESTEMPTIPTEAVGKGDDIPVLMDEPAGLKSIIVETDVYKMEIDTKGGTITKLWLTDYAQSTDMPEDKYLLLENNSKENYFILQSGIIGEIKDAAPNHKAPFKSENESYKLADGSEELTVPLIWQGTSGVTVEKKFIFRRGSYLIKMEQKVVNNGGQQWAGRDYRQIVRRKPVAETGAGFVYTYTGGAFFSPETKFDKVEFDEMDSTALAQDVMGGWIAMIQHYFIGALIPEPGEKAHFYSNKLSNNEYIIGSYGPAQRIEPGENTVFKGNLWLGPKLQQQLENTAAGLELTTDYGWLTIFAKPIFWFLNYIHQWVGNWGWSTVILTILIKLAFYRLSAASYRSMAAMRKLSPKLQAIKERYGEDKERFNKAMMELYQKEKVNPVGGCLPILVQMPVFIALYWVLLESVELRDAPFILWINSLSAKDPYFVLPVIMGISMLIQQKLNPTPPDPMQAKIMMALPFIFTAMFAFFPSGLVLYWVVNNVLSIAQQWRITQVIDKAGSRD